MDGACWVCFCCRHSPVQDTNVRIFWVRAMECMCAQTRPRFILSSTRVLGNGVRTQANSMGKTPSTAGLEKDRTRDTASRRTASLRHYRLSYSGLTSRLQTTHTVTFEVSSGPTGGELFPPPSPPPRLQISHNVTFEVSSGPTGCELVRPHIQTPNYPHCYLWGVLRAHRGGGGLFRPYTQTPNYPHCYLWGVLWAHRAGGLFRPYTQTPN